MRCNGCPTLITKKTSRRVPGGVFCLDCYEKGHGSFPNPAKKKGPTKPTGRRYKSVSDLMKGEGVSKEVQRRVRKLTKGKPKPKTLLKRLKRCLSVVKLK